MMLKEGKNNYNKSNYSSNLSWARRFTITAHFSVFLLLETYVEVFYAKLIKHTFTFLMPPRTTSNDWINEFKQMNSWDVFSSFGNSDKRQARQGKARQAPFGPWGLFKVAAMMDEILRGNLQMGRDLFARKIILNHFAVIYLCRSHVCNRTDGSVSLLWFQRLVNNFYSSTPLPLSQ